MDNLLGVVQAKDILSSIFKEENLNIKNYLKKTIDSTRKSSITRYIKII
ncbi:hypothetical protein [Methanobrevibacter arboriphilus]